MFIRSWLHWLRRIFFGFFTASFCSVSRRKYDCADADIGHDEQHSHRVGDVPAVIAAEYAECEPQAYHVQYGYHEHRPEHKAPRQRQYAVPAIPDALVTVDEALDTGSENKRNPLKRVHVRHGNAGFTQLKTLVYVQSILPTKR